MSGSGGVSMVRPARGENRFYVSPAMRKHQDQKQQQPKPPPASAKQAVAAEEPDQCGADSNCSVSSRVEGDRAAADPNLSNLDRFIEHTTPVVPGQFLPKRSTRRWRALGVKESRAPESFFILGDLWESFKEWSAYGAGVPVVLNGSDTVIQYYVPYLSGIQIYLDPSRPEPRLRRPGEDSDAESSRETSSNGSSEYGSELSGSRGPWNQPFANAKSWSRGRPVHVNNKDSSSDESEKASLQGQLVFEYLEHASPFTREPLADKISALASQFPQLKTYRSCDLSPSSWISVAWYPIYRIPMGPTLQNLDACFLTFHSLSTPSHGQNSDAMHLHESSFREVHGRDIPSKLHLPTFGLASYKFKVSFWNSNGVYESQKVTSLLQAADNWLRLLQVSHPDYKFFVSHGSNWR